MSLCGFLGRFEDFLNSLVVVVRVDMIDEQWGDEEGDDRADVENKEHAV